MEIQVIIDQILKKKKIEAKEINKSKRMAQEAKA